MCGRVRGLISRELFVGEVEPSRKHMKPITNRDLSNKPFGGLWTSHYNETYGSTWVQWCIVEDFGISDEGFDSWVLDVDCQPKLLIIDSLSDLIQALQTYRMTYGSDHPLYRFNTVLPMLDFEVLSIDFDGLHLTARGQAETRLSYPESLYGWDCESTLWFHWCFSKVEHLGKKNFMVDQ